jgi:hypothetical protein
VHAHKTGRWAKKIRRVTHYFGRWDNPQAALDKYLAQKDELLAARIPQALANEITIRDLVNEFLTPSVFSCAHLILLDRERKGRPAKSRAAKCRFAPTGIRFSRALRSNQATLIRLKNRRKAIKSPLMPMPVPSKASEAGSGRSLMMLYVGPAPAVLIGK